MPKKRVPSVRPPAQPLPLDARPKNQRLAALPTEGVRRVPPSPGASDRDGLVAAKTARRATEDAVTTAGDRSTNSPTDRRARVTDADIARGAYLLYLARGCEHGHDVKDWLQAERALRAAVSSARPWVM